MRRRLLDLCLLAYPSATRRRDRNCLRDLALELAERQGLARQLASLLRGGIGERFAAGRPRWTRRAVAVTLVVVAAGLVAAIVPSAPQAKVEVERFACEVDTAAEGSCAAGWRRLAEYRARGWSCTADGRPGEERASNWRCTRGDERSPAAAPADRKPAAARKPVVERRPTAAGAATPKARVDAFLDREWPRKASGTVLVSHDGRAIACRGFGYADRARQIRASCDTAYDLMSMTKQFTAAAILKLQMMGRLRVGEPIDRFLDGVPPDKRGITIAELLDQTSGLVDSLGGDYEPLSRGRMLREAMRSRLLSPPGRAYNYSNVNYSLLAVIVEAASGTGYERFLRRHLFAPAGMWQTGYVLPHWRPGQVAVEYDREGHAHGRPFEHPWAKGGPYWNLRGNGGMISTARDMLRWDRALLGDSVLDARAKHELYAARVNEYPGEFYAYGWNVLRPSLGRLAIHNGGNEWGFGVFARLLPSPAARRLPSRAMVFFVSNDGYRAGLPAHEFDLTKGLLRAALPRRR